MSDPILYLKPAQLAARWQCNVTKVLTFIRKGELRAFDMSVNPGSGLPRWRILLDAVLAFESRRSVSKPAKRRRRKRSTPEIVEFFK